MEWFDSLAGKWQRVLIAVVVVVLLVGAQILREMVQTEEVDRHAGEGSAGDPFL